MRIWKCDKCDEADNTNCVLNASADTPCDQALSPVACPYGFIDLCKWQEQTGREQPQLIQGYTAEQWQEIINGRYLCEFSMDGNFTRCPVYCTLQKFDPEGGSASFLPHPAKGVFAYCRPAQIKGVIRPTWVEPVDPGNAMCVFFYDNGKPASEYSFRWPYPCRTDKVTKYIEL